MLDYPTSDLQKKSAKSIVVLTPETIDEKTAHLPLLMRKALAFLCPLDKGMLDFHLPDGLTYRIAAPHPLPHGELMVHDYNVATRFMKNGEIGFAESYFAGEWNSPDITTFLEVFCQNYDIIRKALQDKPLVRIGLKLFHWMNRNTRRGSRKNIAAHYDLGNHFYQHWLDQTMTYSSGLFQKGAQTIEDAQRAKYEHLANKALITDADDVLEIGCGWGGFAEYLAKERGAKVKAITISQEQYDYTSKRIFEAGLAERVRVHLQDYRDEKGSYDKIVSVEMFEAVGEEFWPVFFQTLHGSLKPQGRAGLQIITIQDQFFDHYRRSTDFIQRYIFPGGMLPSPSRLAELARQHDFAKTSELVFGHDYARTLAEWRIRFQKAWPHIMAHGFDEAFRNMWHYYLSYCEAGFRSGKIDVRQLVYVRK
jgi:cyclopropane-fatty-acyl-phospholipid synthase